jgi:hypothetical protein
LLVFIALLSRNVYVEVDLPSLSENLEFCHHTTTRPGPQGTNVGRQYKNVNFDTKLIMEASNISKVLAGSGALERISSLDPQPIGCRPSRVRVLRLSHTVVASSHD